MPVMLTERFLITAGYRQSSGCVMTHHCYHRAPGTLTAFPELDVARVHERCGDYQHLLAHHVLVDHIFRPENLGFQFLADQTFLARTCWKPLSGIIATRAEVTATKRTPGRLLSDIECVLRRQTTNDGTNDER
jgi:hypothetical protein